VNRWGSRALVVLVLVVGAVAGGGVRADTAPPAAPLETISPEGCTYLTGPDSATPVGVGSCSGVRPGAGFSAAGAGCSLNFVFTDEAGNEYIGTAGHCYVPGGSDVTWAPGAGPFARQDGSTFGHAVFAVLKPGYDFALIRLADGVIADPSMCHFGGPTSLYDAFDSTPLVLHQYGRGIVLGDTVPGRSGFTVTGGNDNMITAYLPVTFGDSGSGVIDSDGRAMGVAVAISANPLGPTVISRLDVGLALAEQRLGIDLTLVTAPLS
jgi:hypothetical protein